MQAVLMPTEWQVNGGLLQLPCFQGCCSADRRIFCALLSCCDTAWFLSKVRKNSCFQGMSQQAAFAWCLGAAAVTTAHWITTLLHQNWGVQGGRYQCRNCQKSHHFLLLSNVSLRTSEEAFQGTLPGPGGPWLFIGMCCLKAIFPSGKWEHRCFLSHMVNGRITREYRKAEVCQLQPMS